MTGAGERKSSSPECALSLSNLHLGVRERARAVRNVSSNNRDKIVLEIGAILRPRHPERSRDDPHGFARRAGARARDRESSLELPNDRSSDLSIAEIATGGLDTPG